MGTQQILLIVLSVIIVGVAIAVGISMFNSQSYNSNKTAIASDAQGFAAQVVQYYKTPQSQGGFGNGTATDPDSGALISLEDVQDALESYLGFTDTVGEGVGVINENGEYWISAIDNTAGTVKITGLGNAVRGSKQPQIVTTVTLPAGTIVAAASDEPVE